MVKEYSVSQFLKEGSFPESGFVVVHGEDEFLHKNVLKKIKKEFKSYNLHRGDEISADKFLELLGEKNLFSSNSKTVNVVWNAEKFLLKLKGNWKKKIPAFFERKIPNLVVLHFITELKKNELSKEPLKSLFSNAALIVKVSKLNKRQIYLLLKRRFQAEGIEVEEGVLEYLSENIDDLNALKVELDKLITYALSSKRLTLEEVKELTFGTVKVTPFDFQDYFFGKDLRSAIQTFEVLTLSLTSYEISALVFQLSGLILSTANRLLIIKEKLKRSGLEKPDGQIFKEVGIFYKFQAAKFERWLSLWGEEELTDLVSGLYGLEKAIKVNFLNPKEEFKRFLVSSL